MDYDPGIWTPLRRAAADITGAMFRMRARIDTDRHIGPELVVILQRAETIVGLIEAEMAAVLPPAGQVRDGVLAQWTQLGLLEDVETGGFL